MITVGIDRVGYPEQRNILSLPTTRYRHERLSNLYRWPTWVQDRLIRNPSHRLRNTFRAFGRQSCPIHHLFNGVSLGHTPWVSTFETFVPRWSRFDVGGSRWGAVARSHLRRGFECLAGEPCRRLIALSECSHRIQRVFMNEFAPDLSASILPKLTVLHPAQALDPTAASRSWTPDGIVRFCFVGRQFFVKGGAETLRAFQHLYESGRRNWRLHLVSTLESQADRPHLTSMSEAEVRGIIARCNGLVTHTHAMDRDAVRSLMRSSDVGLLPSFADTYGYWVLEAQASGLPVVTTNIRALPEINGDSRGWVVPLPTDELGYGRIAIGEESRVASEQLLAGLVDVLERICSQPECVPIKARGALDRIGRHHRPEDAARCLEDIYDRALLGECA
jgi:glycosyltransferase involved in cell wall biosynthesis